MPAHLGKAQQAGQTSKAGVGQPAAVQVGYKQAPAMPGGPLQKGDELGIGKVMQH